MKPIHKAVFPDVNVAHQLFRCERLVLTLETATGKGVDQGGISALALRIKIKT